MSKKIVTFSPVLAESLQHGARVARFSKSLFAGLSRLHDLDSKWLHILFLGAKLHDIGWLHGKKAHHKNSAAMIRAGRISDTQALPIPVEPKIRHLVAMVARYHRRAEPHILHARFAALSKKDRKAMLFLAGIIRLADALDFSHTGAVKDIYIHLHSDTIHLALLSKVDCQAEVDRVAVKKGLFCKTFQRHVTCSPVIHD